MSEVGLTIPMDSLLRLPLEAVYTARSGQAGVKVSRGKTAGGGETIYVYASCDSLALECGRYERTVTSLNRRISELQNRTETEPRPGAILTALKWFLMGLVSGAVIMTIVIIILKKK